MNQEVLNQFVATMTEMLKGAKDFSLEQAPIVCREILRFAIAKDIFYLVVCLIVLIVVAFPVRWVLRKQREEWGQSEPWFLLLFPSAIIGALMAMTIADTAVDLLKATMAPRVYLIEYFTDMIKPHSKGG